MKQAKGGQNFSGGFSNNARYAAACRFIFEVMDEIE